MVAAGPIDTTDLGHLRQRHQGGGGRLYIKGRSGPPLPIKERRPLWTAFLIGIGQVFEPAKRAGSAVAPRRVSVG